MAEEVHMTDAVREEEELQYGHGSMTEQQLNEKLVILAIHDTVQAK